MLRRSPRFHSGIQTLPRELLIEIVLQLKSSPKDLANLRRTSKAFKDFIDKVIVKQLLAKESIHIDKYKGFDDLNKPSRLEETVRSKQSDGHRYSNLQREGFTDVELINFWTLFGAKFRRSRGFPFREGRGIQATIPLQREYSCSVPWTTAFAEGVVQARIDHIDNVLVTTHDDGGINVICLDTGDVLCEVSSDINPDILEYSEGYLLACDMSSNIQIWRLGRLSRTRRSSSQRGILHEHGGLKCDGQLKACRFHFPDLVILTSDGRLLVYNVPDERKLQEIDARPGVAPAGQGEPWIPVAVDFDDEHYITLFERATVFQGAFSNSTAGNTTETSPPWSLQIFSRQTNQRLWCLDPTSFGSPPKRYKCQLQSAVFCPVGVWYGPQRISRFKAKVAWPSNGSCVGLKLDPNTRSLLLLWGDHLIIFSDYKKTWQQDVKTSYQPTILTFTPKYGFEEGMERAFTVGTCGTTSLACFSFAETKVLIDLPKLLLGDIKRAIACLRFYSPDHHCPEQLRSRCSSIQIDSTSLVFQVVDGCDVRPPIPRGHDPEYCRCRKCRERWRHEVDLMNGDVDEDDWRERSIVMVFNWAEALGPRKKTSSGKEKRRKPRILKLPGNEPHPIRAEM